VSEENVKLAGELFAAWERGDFDDILDRCSPEIELVQPPQVPDAKSYRGHKGVLEAFEDWPQQWDEFDVELEEIVDVDRDRVILVHRQRLTARGATMDQEVYFLTTFKAAKATRVDMFFSREEALEPARGPA
jgi:ketosteroid isomerase-like protein